MFLPFCGPSNTAWVLNLSIGYSSGGGLELAEYWWNWHQNFSSLIDFVEKTLGESKFSTKIFFDKNNFRPRRFYFFFFGFRQKIISKGIFLEKFSCRKIQNLENWMDQLNAVFAFQFLSRGNKYRNKWIGINAE